MRLENSLSANSLSALVGQIIVQRQTERKEGFSFGDHHCSPSELQTCRSRWLINFLTA